MVNEKTADFIPLPQQIYVGWGSQALPAASSNRYFITRFFG